MINLSLGIDPGSEGFFALVDMESRKLVGSFKIPMTPDKDFDAVKATELLNGILSDVDGVISRCVLEQVHAIFGSSAKSTFQFGGIFHSLKTFLYMSGISFVCVPPKTWQKVMWVGVRPILKAGKVSTKDMSLSAAKRLFPEESFLRTPKCKNPDDNFVDASLLAYYACLN